MITVLEDGPRFVIVKPFQSADFSFLKKKFELSLQSEGACKLGFAVVCRRLDLKNLCFSFFWILFEIFYMGFSSMCLRMVLASAYEISSKESEKTKLPGL